MTVSACGGQRRRRRSWSDDEIDDRNEAREQHGEATTRNTNLDVTKARQKAAELEGALRRKHGLPTFLDGVNPLLQFGAGKGMEFESELCIEDGPGHPVPMVHGVFGEPNSRRRSLGKLGRDLKRLRIELGIVDRE